MNIGYVTTYNARYLAGSNEWSGTGYYIAKALINQGLSLEYFGPLEESPVVRITQKLKSRYYRYFHGRHYEKDADLLPLKGYANQISEKISRNSIDIVFSATSRPVAYLECKQPIVFWADATCAGLLGFYHQYDSLCQESFYNWHLIEKLALQKCKLAIYSSDWAAKTAVENYDADPSKVRVVPFGANIDSSRTFDEVKDLVESRPSDCCKLLFLGVDWHRKGGDIAVQVAQELNGLGLDTELTVVGCHPPSERTYPDFIKFLGFISKSTKVGKEKINQLISESHFLIVPSQAECYGVVFCEANSFGVPCISCQVGGVPTAIRQDINGKLFDVNTDVSEYCRYIYELFLNYEDYKRLAISAYDEYRLRLNWGVAGQTVKNLLEEIAL